MFYFKYIIKKIVCFNLYIYINYLKISFYIQRKNYYSKIKNSNFKNNIISRVDIVKKVKERKNLKKSDVCHIIGSGWSLNESINKISGNDFVIGFNYAALASVNFDAYFFEFGGSSVELTSKNHLILAREKVSKNTDLLFFKNIWDRKNDIEYISENWADIAFLIKDRVYPLMDNRYTDFIINKAFNDEAGFFPQICSTTVTAIILAYQAGFDKIIIHGLDFGGKYFYEENTRLESSTIFFKDMFEPGFYNKTKNNSVHPTATGVGMKEILPAMYCFLKENKVELFCATEKSPSSIYVPVYK